MARRNLRNPTGCRHRGLLSHRTSAYGSPSRTNSLLPITCRSAATCMLPPASASYIVWLDSRPTARYAESERRGRVNRVRSVVADGPQDLGVMTELARHWQAGG